MAGQNHFFSWSQGFSKHKDSSNDKIPAPEESLNMVLNLHRLLILISRLWMEASCAWSSGSEMHKDLKSTGLVLGEAEVSSSWTG